MLKLNSVWMVMMLAVLAGCEAPSMEEGQDVHWGDSETLCEAAVAHVAECAGQHVDLSGDGCDPVDAELLLEIPCEVLAGASQMPMDQKADSAYGEQVSFSCKWFGVGCPVDDSCFPSLSAAAVEQLIVLSDPMTLVDEYDTRYRIEAIASIFEAEPDPIGMFSIVYRHITNNAVYSVEEGYYEHEQWTRNLITAFARRYLVNLHGHLTGGHVTHPWRKYYKLARDCNVGRGRVLGVAIATHLLVDLAYAVHDVEGVAKHEEDYMVFGEISLWVFPNLVADIQSVYGADVSGLLKGFFFGEWIDSVSKEGFATEFIYQTVRRNSWRNSQNLWHFPKWMVTGDIKGCWGMAEVALAALDAGGAL